MSGTKKYDWPPDDKLVAMVDKHGLRKMSRKLNVPYTSLHGQYQRAKKRLSDDGGVSQEDVYRHRAEEAERRLRSQTKVDVYNERVIDALERAVQARQPRFNPRVIKKSHRVSTKHEFVLLRSDDHAGEVVSAEETNGINEYDWQIMLKRWNNLRESLFSYQDNRPYPVEKLHVFGLGDNLSGEIHDELVATNEIPLAEASVQWGMDFSEWAMSLRERFSEVPIAGVYGNHGRATKKPAAKLGYNNADWTALHVARLATRGVPGLTWEISKAGRLPVVVAKNWRCLLYHGDGIRTTMPGVPWGGVVRRASELQNEYSAADMPFDVLCVGHFHQANVTRGPRKSRIVMNGTVKGVDEYSLKAFGGGAPPEQVLLTFHPRKGLTDVSFLDCERRER